MASTEPYMGSIDFTGFPFPIRSWALAQGQLLPISQNDALFYLLGTYWGGDGKTTFALPNLAGRVPMGHGQGPGLSKRVIGEAVGQEQVTLGAAHLPAHTHPVQLGGAGSTDAPAGPAVQGTSTGTGARTTPSGAAGGNEPVPTLPPSLVMAPQVAIYGIFPSQQ